MNICLKITDVSHIPPPQKGSSYTVISAKNIKNGKIISTDNDRYADEERFLKENKRTRISRGGIKLGIMRSYKLNNLIDKVIT